MLTDINFKKSFCLIEGCVTYLFQCMMWKTTAVIYKIKRSRVEVEETGNNEAAENSSDTGIESEHNNNSTVSSPSPCQDDDSRGEKKEDFSTFLQRNYFGHCVLIQVTSSCTGDRKLEASYISFVTRQKVLVAFVCMFAHVACR